MRNFFFVFIIMSAVVASSCGENGPPLETAGRVDILRYCGTWYEIARIPNSFEKGLVCVTATYTLGDDGRINVLNRGKLEFNRSKGREAHGIARVVNRAEPGVLEVSFFRPFWGDYSIIELDPEYRYALVGTRNRRYLWILSREMSLEQPVYDRLIARARETGFDVDRLYRTPQICPER
mgnify:CR=1 FL=1